MSDTAQFDFQLLAESSVDLIMLVGIDRVMHYVSPSSVQLLGWEPSEMTERLADDFIFADDLLMVHRAAAEALSPGGDKQSVTMRMVNREGRCVWMEVNARVLGMRRAQRSTLWS